MDREKHLTIPHNACHYGASNETEMQPLKKLHRGRGTGRDCSVIEFVLLYLPSRPYKVTSLPDTFWEEGGKRPGDSESGQISAP
jgi:hypothetical protein